jgi:hypothetical protein
VPLVNLSFAPRLADASVFSWLLLFVPLANIYVWWDWWSETAFDHRHRHPDRWAMGMFVPFLEREREDKQIVDDDTREKNDPERHRSEQLRERGDARVDL